MNKAELEAAISTLDTFIQIFAVLVAIGILGEVGFGVKHWVLSRRLAVIQRAEDLSQEQIIATLNKEAGDARRDAGLAMERAGKAEENLGDAKKDAADANERAARLEVEALQLRKELVLQGPRANLITGDTRKKLVDKLRPFANQLIDIRHQASVIQVNGHNVQVTPIGDDTLGLANSLIGVVKDARWSVPSKPIPSNASGEGVTVEIGNKASDRARLAASALADALRQIPLAVSGPLQPLPPQLRQRVGDEHIEPPFGDDTIVVDVLIHP